MADFPPSLERLIDCFAALPGIGRKSAQRLAFHVLSMPKERAASFAEAITEATGAVHYCPVCMNLTDGDKCSICRDDRRDHGIICVVSDPRDILSFERGREFNGVYHVLHGAISPLNHIGPDDLKISELIERVNGGGVREVIMATNPDTEGDTTAMYLARLIKPFDILVSRIAYGIPVGANLEYADEVTLSRALEGRREM